MSAPKNRRLRKTLWHVAVRMAAVRAAHAAFPQLGARELGAALGVTRSQVRHYLLGDIKGCVARVPPWAEPFFSACRELARGNTTTAALELERVARMVDAFGDSARKISP